MYFSGRWLAYQHTELLSRVAIWACDNPFTLQETPTQTFEAFFFFCSTWLCTFSSEPDSSANNVSTMHNAWQKKKMRESWEPCWTFFYICTFIYIVHVCRDNWINCTHAKYLRNTLVSTLVVVFLLTVLYFQLGHKVRVGTSSTLRKVIFGLKMLVFTNGFAGLFVNSFAICLTKTLLC